MAVWYSEELWSMTRHRFQHLKFLLMSTHILRTTYDLLKCLILTINISSVIKGISERQYAGIFKKR